VSSRLAIKYFPQYFFRPAAYRQEYLFDLPPILRNSVTILSEQCIFRFLFSLSKIIIFVQSKIQVQILLSLTAQKSLNSRSPDECNYVTGRRMPGGQQSRRAPGHSQKVFRILFS